MKKYILLLPGAVFPYTLLFALYCVFTGFLTDSLFNNNVLILLFYLFCFSWFRWPVISFFSFWVFVKIGIRVKFLWQI